MLLFCWNCYFNSDLSTQTSALFLTTRSLPVCNCPRNKSIYDIRMQHTLMVCFRVVENELQRTNHGLCCGVWLFIDPCLRGIRCCAVFHCNLKLFKYRLLNHYFAEMQMFSWNLSLVSWLNLSVVTCFNCDLSHTKISTPVQWIYRFRHKEVLPVQLYS